MIFPSFSYFISKFFSSNSLDTSTFPSLVFHLYILSHKLSLTTSPPSDTASVYRYIGTTRSRTLCYSLITIIIILIITIIIIIIIIVVSDCVFYILYIEICMYENVKKKKRKLFFFFYFLDGRAHVYTCPVNGWY